MTENQPRTAGAFDVRFVIATLIGAYGVILTATGLFWTSDAQLDKSDGLNVNLWAGIGMIVVAGAFVLWARLRPVVIRREDLPVDDDMR